MDKRIDDQSNVSFCGKSVDKFTYAPIGRAYGGIAAKYWTWAFRRSSLGTGTETTSEVNRVMTGRFLTETEVSQQTHISLGTLRRWRLEDRGPHYYKFGSLVRYAESDLDIWLVAQPCGGGSHDRRQPTTADARSLLRKSG